MKVIAIKRDRGYVCEVSHSELEKFLGLYYGKLDSLKEGDSIDLSKGFDFHHATLSALKKTQEFIESNGELIRAIMTGITVMGRTDRAIENPEAS